MLTGSCLCGAITYEITGSPGATGHCHCRMCQKAHGAPYATYAELDQDQFRLLAGADALASYRSSEQIQRTFCRHCGANLQFLRDGSPRFGLALGTLDGDPGITASYEIWTRCRVEWGRIHDRLESHETEPDRPILTGE